MASKAENCRKSISTRIFDNVIANWTFCVEQFFFISKVAIIKTKSVTIAFFLVLALSFSPFLFLRYCDFGAVLGLKKPAF